MGYFFLAAIMAMFADSKITKGNNKKSYKKSKKHRSSYRKDNSWLDAAWYHDHGQRI